MDETADPRGVRHPVTASRRVGVDDMTAALAFRGIPLTIFCAGYGNVAMEILRRGAPRITGPGGAFTPHLRLVANFFRVSRGVGSA